MPRDSDDDSESDLSENDEEELQLPEELINLSTREKKALLKFKRSHNEVQWEEELLRLSQTFEKSRDLQRLKSMMGKGTTENEKKTTSRAKKVVPIKGKQKPVQLSESEESTGMVSEGSVQSSEDEDFQAKDEDEEDDDELFNSEEEEEISNRPAPSQGKSRKDMSESEEEEEGGGKGNAKKRGRPPSKKSKEDEKEKVKGKGKERGARGRVSRARNKKGSDDEDSEREREKEALLASTPKRPVKGREKKGKENEKELLLKKWAAVGVGGGGGGGLEGYEMDSDEEREGADGQGKEEYSEEEEDSVMEVEEVGRGRGTRFRDRDREGDREGGSPRDVGLFSDTSTLLETHFPSDNEGEVRDEKKQEPLASLQDYQPLQLTRNKLVRMLMHPYLARMVRGAFVKVVVDQGQGKGQPLYRMARVLGTQPATKPYCPDPKFPNMRTQVKLVVFLGGQSSSFRLTSVSNQPFLAQELNIFIQSYEAFKRAFPSSPLPSPALSRSTATRRLARMKALQNKVLTSKQVDEMVRHRHGLDMSLLSDPSTAIASLDSVLKSLEAQLFDKTSQREERGEEDPDEEEMVLMRQRKEVENTLLNMRAREEKRQQGLEAQARPALLLNRSHLEENRRKDQMASRILQQGRGQGQETSDSNNPYIIVETVSTNSFMTPEEARARHEAETAKKNKEKEEKDRKEAELEEEKKFDPRERERRRKVREQREAQEKELAKAQERLGKAKLRLKGRVQAKEAGSLEGRGEDSSLDDVRARVKAQLGFDPYLYRSNVSSAEKRERYLNRVCSNLPPLNDIFGAQERDKLRNGLSLVQWFELGGYTQ